ncbi:MAG TPA: TetR/AcrR family transcriptional regulator [Acidimicrobiales bacterium]|nr:TetR/AcrR family transcriptional regulator [Acidimicrobiales bacterium]
MDRRVRRTQNALRNAFVALVLERGYESLSVEDITERADVARATFYSHYADKEALFTAIFGDLVDALVTRVAAVPVQRSVINTKSVLGELFSHAEELADLYQVCLSRTGSARARDAYVATVARAAEARFAERIRQAGSSPRVPVALIALAFAGAHTALLTDWLERGRPWPADDMAELEAQLLMNGFGWAFGMESETFSMEERPEPVG